MNEYLRPDEINFNRTQSVGIDEAERACDFE